MIHINIPGIQVLKPVYTGVKFHSDVANTVEYTEAGSEKYDGWRITGGIDATKETNI